MKALGLLSMYSCLVHHPGHCLSDREAACGAGGVRSRPMSVTVENIVAAHGHIACGIRETQDGREPGVRGNSRFPLHFVSHLLKPDAALKAQVTSTILSPQRAR